MFTPWSVLGIRKNSDWAIIWERLAGKLRAAKDVRSRRDIIASYEAIGDARWTRFRPNQAKALASGDNLPSIDQQVNFDVAAYEGPFESELRALDRALKSDDAMSFETARTLLISIQSDPQMRIARNYTKVEPAIAALLVKNLPLTEPLIAETLSEFHGGDHFSNDPAMAHLESLFDETRWINDLSTENDAYGRAYRSLNQQQSAASRWLKARTRHRFFVGRLLSWAAFDSATLDARFADSEREWWWSEISRQRLQIADLIYFVLLAFLAAGTALWSGVTPTLSILVGSAVATILLVDRVLKFFVFSRWPSKRIDGLNVLLAGLCSAILPIIVASIGIEYVGITTLVIASFLIVWWMRCSIRVSPSYDEGHEADARRVFLVIAVLAGWFHTSLGPLGFAGLIVLAWMMTETLIAYQSPLVLSLKQIGQKAVLLACVALCAVSVYAAAVTWVLSEWLIALLIPAVGLGGLAAVKSATMSANSARGIAMGVCALALLFSNQTSTNTPRLAENATASQILMLAKDPRVDWRQFPVNGAMILDNMRVNNSGFYSKVLNIIDEANCGRGRVCYSYDLEMAIAEEVLRLRPMTSNDHIAQINVATRDYFQEVIVTDPIGCSSSLIPQMEIASARINREFARIQLEIVSDGPRPERERKDVAMPSERFLKSHHKKWKDAMVPRSGFVGPYAAAKHTCAGELVRAAADSQLTVDQQGTMVRLNHQAQIDFARKAGLRNTP